MTKHMETTRLTISESIVAQIERTHIQYHVKCTTKYDLWEIGYVRPIIRCHNRSQQWNWRRSRIEIVETFLWMNKNDEKTRVYVYIIIIMKSAGRVFAFVDENSVKVSFRVARFVFVWRARIVWNLCTFGWMYRFRNSWFFFEYTHMSKRHNRMKVK